MDIAVLLLSMCLFFAIGMPIAYALALSALVGALWIDLPVGAVMQQFASGVGKVSMLTIPFFVLAGAIMAEGGMAAALATEMSGYVAPSPPPGSCRLCVTS